MTIVVGTANRHKIEEIAAVLHDLSLRDGRSVTVVGAECLPDGDPIAETGSTFAENARIKARAYARRALALPEDSRPSWVIADDSGLCVDALEGAPGVHSARYAGLESSDRSAVDRANNELLLENLRGKARPERGAEFLCVIACAGILKGSMGLGREEILFSVEGRCRGEILPEERGTGGFGYDPLFFIPEMGKTFAEISQAEKNCRSHRGRALRLLREKLQDWGTPDPTPGRGEG